MQNDKVKIADGKEETRDNLNLFKAEYNKNNPKNKIKTLGDTIDHLIEEARLNSKLRENNEWLRDENKKLENRIKELEGRMKDKGVENTILKKSTINRLEELKRKDEIFDNLINRLIDEREEDIVLSGGII